MAKTEQQIVSKANNRFRKLIQKDILKKDAIITGDMLRSIDPVFRLKKKKILIELGAIYYYEYVDQGTKGKHGTKRKQGTQGIKARNITTDVLESKAFLEIAEDLSFDLYELQVDLMLSKLGKGKNIKITL